MTCKNQPEALRLAAQLEDTKSARLPTWQDMLGDAEQLVRQKPTFSKYIRGTALENDVPVWIADFAQRLLLRELTRFALRAHAAALEEAAQVCEDLDEEAICKEGRLASGRECAAAIRAMKEQA